MHKISDDKTLLEDLVAKGIIPTRLEKIPYNLNYIKFLIDKHFFHYLKNLCYTGFR